MAPLRSLTWGRWWARMPAPAPGASLPSPVSKISNPNSLLELAHSNIARGEGHVHCYANIAPDAALHRRQHRHLDRRAECWLGDATALWLARSPWRDRSSGGDRFLRRAAAGRYTGRGATCCVAGTSARLASLASGGVSQT